MARYAPCVEAARQRMHTECVHRRPTFVEAARQRVSTECVHRRSTFASMRNTDSESDMESDADMESVVVDECADCCLGRSSARHQTQDAKPP